MAPPWPAVGQHGTASGGGSAPPPPARPPFRRHRVLFSRLLPGHLRGAHDLTWVMARAPFPEGSGPVHGVTRYHRCQPKMSGTQRAPSLHLPWLLLALTMSLCHSLALAITHLHGPFSPEGLCPLPLCLEPLVFTPAAAFAKRRARLPRRAGAGVRSRADLQRSM